jgi:organic radical activating enzyme
MSNNFCRFLSNGYKINVENNELLWSPCCHYTRKIPLLNKEAFQKELSYTSGATTWLPECTSCKNMERNQVELFSPTRKNSLIRIPNDTPNGVCADLEISFDTKCNAACVSCGSNFSSLWGLLDSKKHNTDPSIFKYQQLTIHSDLLLQKLIDHIPMDQLRTVFLLGGEPFFSDTHLKLLEHINSVHTNLSELTLIYKTNGSIFPNDNHRKYWHLYKKVVISFSVDSIGEQFEYLRWPLKWDKVEQVIDQFVQLSDANIKLSFTNTISPLNLLYWSDLEEWIRQHVPNNKLLDSTVLVYPNRCWGNLDLSYSPAPMRKIIMESPHCGRNLKNLLSAIPINSNFYAMTDYLNSIDKDRNLEWQQVFAKASVLLQ